VGTESSEKVLFIKTTGDEFFTRIPEVNEMNEKLANPAPLGLLGFGITTVLLNLHNAGFYPLNSMILAMGLAYGGLAQVMAGIMEYRKGNTFGTTAFSSYGLFWWSLVVLLVLPRLRIFDVFATSPLQAPDSSALAAYFFMWGLFTFVMFFGTLKANRALQFVFLSLAVLFFLLTAKELTGNTDLGLVAGYEGIICGLSAVYTALAEVINEVYEKTILPLFPTS
jgi:succinate-acetate transporter protein